jgi:protein involved in polysaccharide export with SLBB domain
MTVVREFENLRKIERRSPTHHHGPGGAAKERETMAHSETLRAGVPAQALIVLCAFGIAVSACSSVGRRLPPPEETYALTSGPIDRGDYRLQANDRLHIKFPYQPRANQELPVRPDGKISLDVTGEIVAEGLTPHELEALIKEKAASRLRDPEVVVIVTGIGDRRAYVGGEVGRPGFVSVQDGMTPLQAVLAAGGFKDTAQKDSVLYIARGASGAYRASRVDLEDVLRNGVPETVRLMGNDVVYVPATRIANLGTFVEQYIRKVLPVDSRAGASAAIPVP